MAKLCGQDVLADEERRIEAKVEAVLEQFGGDVHAAILALLQEFAALVHEASTLEVGIFDLRVAEMHPSEEEDPEPDGPSRRLAARRLQ